MKSKAKKIQLLKIATREDANYGQEERYPSGTVIKTGYMDDDTRPKIGEPFIVYTVRLWDGLRTSIVESINNIDDNTIEIKTLNSIYHIQIIE